MTASKANRVIERHYFEQFRGAYPLPPGEISYSDRPDVLIRGDRTVGIEITNFYLRDGSDPKSEQQQRDLRRRSLEKAHQLYRAESSRGLELIVTFNPEVPLTPTSRKMLPVQLAAFAAQNEHLPSGPYYGNGLPPEILCVWLSNKDWPNPTWTRRCQVYTVEDMAVPRLQEIVAAKEAKAKKYEKCDAYWLLVVVDWIDGAQEQEITSTRLKLTSSVYEKIIVYKPTFNEIVEARKWPPHPHECYAP
jgi:hypothetical protein